MRDIVRWILLVGASGLMACVARSTNIRQLPTTKAEKRTELYKTVDGTRLMMDIYEPQKVLRDQAPPAIVFFFGGGWSSGSLQQFAPQAQYLASRGMVAILADYRVRSRHQSKVVDSIADARSAIRWVRANAKKLGIDPNRIAAAGGSAGGHLAACTALISEFDDPKENPKVSAAPNALILYNPALVLAKIPGEEFNALKAVPDRSFLGADAIRISPFHHLKSGAPPTIIFHGLSDQTVPFSTVKLFSEKMKSLGNSCSLTSYPNQGHGFFNQEPYLRKTLVGTDEFLVSIGWLKGAQTLNILR